MPTYQYACTSCGERLEVVQKYSDEPLSVCPACAGALRKVFSPVGVVFKGSGFYKTDSRSSRSTAGSSDKSGTTDTGSSKPAADTGSAGTNKDAASKETSSAGTATGGGAGKATEVA